MTVTVTKVPVFPRDSRGEGFMLDLGVKSQWLDALRHRYEKAKSTLADGRGGYCCLGVYQCEFGVPAGHEGLLADETETEFYAIPHNIQVTLAEINDNSDGFGEVIAYIEGNL